MDTDFVTSGGAGGRDPFPHWSMRQSVPVLPSVVNTYNPQVPVTASKNLVTAVSAPNLDTIDERDEDIYQYIKQTVKGFDY